MAFIIIFLWLGCIVLFMSTHLSFSNPLIYLLTLIQMHLYTGLFITAHDAMHGTVAPHNQKLNSLIGQVSTALYALFPFGNLNTKHHKHHQFVHTKEDPDYHQGNFFIWYFSFIKQYITWWQIVAMAIIYNVLKIWIIEQNLLMFWVIPSLLSTLQLFYFGTYLPHKGEHQNKHQSKSQSKNHIWAFFSCYFFGYHYEHHDSPVTPWWKLWQQKEKNLEI
ncbi:fatty acid desaturase [Pedobacter cryophilus]|uniref:Fatty acid desaturase n=2 Tax=Pedobacter cryophilus TaxID=2571271 RepID=A0A4U1C684_9SPHI|nr:fatty acid desaturase [Pedobacter cryophilus]